MVVIPWPNEDVASLHLPHIKSRGWPTSSISNSILFNIPIFSKNNLNFSIPNFCAIFIDPILDDLTKICYAVSFYGIFLSYSSIEYPAQISFFSKFLNSVFGSTMPSSNAAANVKVLKTEPSS